MKKKIAVNAASGKMGQQVINQIITNKKAELVSAFCRPNHRLLGRKVNYTETVYTSNTEANLGACDVVIDFSLPQATLKLIEAALKSNTAVLIGTTGFSEVELLIITEAAQSIPILLAPNTSIGVNSTLALLSLAAKMLGKKADIEIIESHHKHKVDAPSGTAIRMGQTITEAMGKNLADLQVTESRFEKRTREKGEIGFSSIRAGEIIGEHKVIFALDNEIISIEHKAQNRHCFSEGAVLAAIWLASQKKGLYSMQDFLADKSK